MQATSESSTSYSGGIFGCTCKEVRVLLWAVSTSFMRDADSNENDGRLFLDNACCGGDSDPKDCDSPGGLLALISGFG